MSKTRDNYQVQANNLPELVLGLNLLLQRMADRMDRIEGIRGVASIESDLDMNMNNINELELSITESDAVTKAELPNQDLSDTDSPTFVDLTVTDDALIGDDLTVNGVTNMASLLLSGALSGATMILTGSTQTTGSYKYTDSNSQILHTFATLT